MIFWSAWATTKLTALAPAAKGHRHGVYNYIWPADTCLQSHRGRQLYAAWLSVLQKKSNCIFVAITTAELQYPPSYPNALLPNQVHSRILSMGSEKTPEVQVQKTQKCYRNTRQLINPPATTNHTATIYIYIITIWLWFKKKVRRHCEEKERERERWWL